MADEIRLMPDGGYRVHQETRHFDGEKGCYTIWSVRDVAGEIVHSYQGDAFAETGARTLCERLNAAWAAGRESVAMPADARDKIIDPILSAWFGLKRDQCNESEIDDARMLADAVLSALAGGSQ